MDKPKKILVIGSGAIKIAEAAEFDYSGTQALKAFREEGIKTVLVNPNIATVQTSRLFADSVYLLPVKKEFIEKVIKKERPDAIALGFGGQTALNAGVDLERSGVLKRYGVKVLGTSIKDIKKALSRELFRDTMRRRRIPIPESLPARTEEQAVRAAVKIGYPVMLRVSFNLGGRGTSIIWSEEELRKEFYRALEQSYTKELLVEKHLFHWKEIEYEVVRDRYGNSAVTACIENLDPMGIHTGDSVVVTPAQTLDNYEYNEMRRVAIEVAESINLVGECNVQFALDQGSHAYYVIETNPRMSRSSALASKATGYPLAYVSAKLALGYRLYELRNSISKVTTACFEPSLDYVVVKMPRWDFDKFEGIRKELSTEMKSIGEVMSIGRNFEEAMQKAMRMLDIGERGIIGRNFDDRITKRELFRILSSKPAYWPLYVTLALNKGYSVEEISDATGIDGFFINKMKGVVESSRSGDAEAYGRFGFEDGSSKAVVKQIDTLAGEVPAMTNYLYVTRNGSEHDISFKGRNKLLILGAGTFRIGVSVEFDWSAVSLAAAAGERFDEVSLINCNPETVSTDWDVASKLYFDELSVRNIAEINSLEGFSKVATFTAGQVGNNIAKGLERRGIEIFGTQGRSIEIAEDRKRFSELLERLGIKQPGWISTKEPRAARAFAEAVGFPVLLRPSYVLSGSAMSIVRNPKRLEEFMRNALAASKNNAVVVSRFLEDGIEVDLDCVSDGTNVFGVLLEQLEEAGVHSGDSTSSSRRIRVSRREELEIQRIALKLANELEIKGPFNIQMVVRNGEVYVLELNLRASRSMPFSSKVTGIDFMRLSVKGIMERFGWNGFKSLDQGFFGVKSPQFSWSQLRGAYPFLSPEMRSTGEVASFGNSLNDALLKSWLSAAPNSVPKSRVLMYGRFNRDFLRTAAGRLSESVDTYTLEDDNIMVDGCIGISQAKAMEMLKSKKFDLVITDGYMKEIDFGIRRFAVDFNVPIVLNGRLALYLSDALVSNEMSFGDMDSYNKIKKRRLHSL